MRYLRKFNESSERTIVVNDVKPIGNLESILQKLIDKVDRIEKEGYSDEVTRILKLIVEMGFADYDWFEDGDRLESESIVIIGRSLLIRLNNIAQKHFNNMDLGTPAEQLMEDEEFMSYFPNTTFK